MKDRYRTEIPLDANDAKILPALRSRFGKFWSDTNEDPRRKYQIFMEGTAIDDRVEFQPSAPSHPTGLWCLQGSRKPHRAILFLHGGAYSLGDAAAYRGFVSQIAVRTQCSIFTLDYPLAPEVPAPTALNLASTALNELLESYSEVSVVGDSAGGGMTLALLSKSQKRRQVRAGVVFSPWTDLSLSGASIKGKASSEVLLSSDALATAADGYRGALQKDDPQVSPLFSIPQDLPRLLIQVGTEEILLDDSIGYAERAHEAGVRVSLEVWQGLHHVFQLNVKELRSARHALDRAAAFLREAPE